MKLKKTNKKKKTSSSQTGQAPGGIPHFVSPLRPTHSTVLNSSPAHDDHASASTFGSISAPKPVLTSKHVSAPASHDDHALASTFGSISAPKSVLTSKHVSASASHNDHASASHSAKAATSKAPNFVTNHASASAASHNPTGDAAFYTSAQNAAPDFAHTTAPTSTHHVENTQQQLDEDMNISDVEDDSRMLIRVGPDGKLHATSTNEISRTMLEIFDKMWFMEGCRWKELTMAQNFFYWEEFKKYFRWKHPDEDIKRIWNSQAGISYSNTLSNMRTKTKKKRPSIHQDTWKAWEKKWEDPAYKELRQKNSRNRKTEVGGPGTGISHHTGGSRSMIAHHRVLTEKNGEAPSAIELYSTTHMTRTEEGIDWVCEKAGMVGENFHDMLAASRQVETNGDGSERDEVDENQLFFDAAGGNMKQRVYGLGSCGPLYYRDSFSHGKRLSRGQINVCNTIEFKEAVNQAKEEMAVKMLAEMNAHRAQMEAEMKSFRQQMAEMMVGRNGGSASATVHTQSTSST